MFDIMYIDLHFNVTTTETRQSLDVQFPASSSPVVWKFPHETNTREVLCPWEWEAADAMV